jgi:cellulose synthase/poly-beta-1,6-N-acetylglucosamine synthase-like glycosyltransferase
MGISEALLWTYVLTFGGYSIVVLIGALDPFRRTVSACHPGRRLSLGIVVPAYNEMAHLECIEMAISLAREMQVPIVVVDDGSTDGSSGPLQQLCDIGRARFIRHAENRGKPAALNTGIGALNIDLVVTLDADTMVTAGVVEHAASLFSDQTGAVALTIDGIGDSFLARAQGIEYRYVLNFERAALARIGIVFTIPGSASLWRRSALAEIGGFRDRTCAEDTDATISLSLAGWRLAAIRDGRAATECPLAAAALLRQRSRWIWGTIQAAVFALGHVATTWPQRSALSALVFVFVTVLNIFGFVLTINVAWRLAALDLGWSDLVAGVVLIGTTLIRLALVRRLEGGDIGILRILAQLFVIQTVNAAAFWHGLIAGRARQMSW